MNLPSPQDGPLYPEDALELIARSSADVLVLIGSDGRISYISPSVMKYGHSPKDIIGTTGGQLFHPDDVGRAAANTVALLAGKPVQHADLRYRLARGDGAWTWFESNPQAVTDESGRVTGLINVFRDIDASKRSADLAHEQQQLFAAVFEYSASGMVVLSLDGRIQRVNAAMLRQLGYAEDEMIGRRDSEFAHPDEVGQFLTRYYDRLLAGEIDSYSVERRYRRRDGEYIWCTLLTSVARGADGLPLHVIGSLQDLTTARAREAELRQQSWALGAYARSTAALLHAGDIAGITTSVCEAIVADDTYALAVVSLTEPPPSKSVTYRAAAGAAVGYLDGLRLGWSEDETGGSGPTGRAIRTRLTQVVGDCQTDPLFAPWRERAAPFGLRSTVSVPFFEDDRVLGVLLVYAAQPHAFGAFELDLFRKLADELAFAIVLETQRAEQDAARQAMTAAEERMQTLQTQLAHLGRVAAMNEMGAALAHELNQPLSAAGSFLNGAARLLDRSPLDTEMMREGLDAASEQMLRAGGIIRRLREFVAKRDTHRGAEPLVAMIEEACALATIGPVGRSIRPRYQFATPDDARVLVDRIQIQQVILNLIRNAAEAMAASPRRDLLVATAPAAGGMVQVSVSDTGPGVAPEVAAQLFQPFATTKTDGMGVGLSISRGIIEAHGGRLWCDPNPDGGAIFRFTVPAAG